MGDDSSTRRPTLDTMRSMICIRCWLSLKVRPVGSSLPARSTYTRSKRFTRISETVGSLSKGSSGPSPKISSRISRARRSRSAKLSGTASLLTVLRISSRTSSRAVSPGERPSFSRSKRSRILRCRSALTCWYSAFSKACKFAMRLPGAPSLAQSVRTFVRFFYPLIRSTIDYTVLNSDQVVRFTSTSFSVSRPASPMKARAISVWFCCINGTPRSIAVDTAKY